MTTGPSISTFRRTRRVAQPPPRPHSRTGRRVPRGACPRQRPADKGLFGGCVRCRAGMQRGAAGAWLRRARRWWRPGASCRASEERSEWAAPPALPDVQSWPSAVGGRDCAETIGTDPMPGHGAIGHQGVDPGDSTCQQRVGVAGRAGRHRDELVSRRPGYGPRVRACVNGHRRPGRGGPGYGPQDAGATRPTSTRSCRIG